MYLTEENKNINLCLIRSQRREKDRDEAVDIICLGFRERVDIVLDYRIIYLFRLASRVQRKLDVCFVEWYIWHCQR